MEITIPAYVVNILSWVISTTVSLLVLFGIGRTVFRRIHAVLQRRAAAVAQIVEKREQEKEAKERQAKWDAEFKEKREKEELLEKARKCMGDEWYAFYEQLLPIQGLAALQTLGLRMAKRFLPQAFGEDAETYRPTNDHSEKNDPYPTFRLENGDNLRPHLTVEGFNLIRDRFNIINANKLWTHIAPYFTMFVKLPER
jgi:hypothetical protein